LVHDEINTLNRLVVIFLETAELRAKNRSDLTIHFWKENVDRILTSNDLKILIGPGTISNAQMETAVRKIYQTFETRRKALEAEEADQEDLNALQALETLQQEIKAKK
jgi:hypothetical protein